jgi:hypothetical protein
MRGANKTLYIRPEDLPVWQRAQEATWTQRMSLSQLLVEALKLYLSSIDESPPSVNITTRTGGGNDPGGQLTRP